MSVLPGETSLSHARPARVSSILRLTSVVFNSSPSFTFPVCLPSGGLFSTHFSRSSLRISLRARLRPYFFFFLYLFVFLVPVPSELRRRRARIFIGIFASSRAFLFQNVSARARCPASLGCSLAETEGPRGGSSPLPASCERRNRAARPARTRKVETKSSPDLSATLKFQGPREIRANAARSSRTGLPTISFFRRFSAPSSWRYSSGHLAHGLPAGITVRARKHDCQFCGTSYFR